jgi:hypothetical protein
MILDGVDHLKRELTSLEVGQRAFAFRFRSHILSSKSLEGPSAADG